MPALDFFSCSNFNSDISSSSFFITSLASFQSKPTRFALFCNFFALVRLGRLLGTSSKIESRFLSFLSCALTSSHISKLPSAVSVELFAKTCGCRLISFEFSSSTTSLRLKRFCSFAISA